MANTYTQLHIQTIFAVKNRESLIQKEWKTEMYRYVSGIIQNHKHKVLAINGMSDHVHLLFGMRPNQSLSDLMQDIKSSSSRWINEKKLVKGKFEWQAGYGAFSYSKSHVSQVISYIQNQEKHHQSRTFMEEYKDFLVKFDIDYKEQFIFQPVL